MKLSKYIVTCKNDTSKPKPQAKTIYENKMETSLQEKKREH